MPLDFRDDEDDFDDLIIGECDLWDWSARTHLVAGFLGTGELTIAWGPPKQGGKTAFWLRLARRVSQGLPIFGRAVRQAETSSYDPETRSHVKTKPTQRVLYIALENPSDVRDRCDALYEIDGEAPDFRLIMEPINLLDRRLIDRLARYVDRENVVLIVVDTLARALGTADENRGADTGALFDNIARLRGLAENGWSNAHVVLIHHANKAGLNGPRGHGDFAAAPDTLIEHAQRQDGTRTARVVAARADPPGLTLRYRVSPFELSDPARTTVICEEYVERRGRRPGSYAGIALERLRHAVAAAAGEPVPVDPTWRGAFYDAVPNLSAENRRKQFNRARAELVAARQVAITSGAARPAEH